VQLRRFRDSGRKFDVIILDPPKFAETRSRLAGACRGYKDINLLALKLLRPQGHLLTFSCSAAMTPELFRKVVGGAVQDSNRRARVCRQFSQDADHPLSLQFPEGDYLTGLELVVE
jgi:23S rRNA (cytosine1962-C5)-methyltransferase